jgi:hypothetical protein
MIFPHAISIPLSSRLSRAILRGFTRQVHKPSSPIYVHPALNNQFEGFVQRRKPCRSSIPISTVIVRMCLISRSRRDPSLPVLISVFAQADADTTLLLLNPGLRDLYSESRWMCFLTLPQRFFKP